MHIEEVILPNGEFIPLSPDGDHSNITVDEMNRRFVIQQSGNYCVQYKLLLSGSPGLVTLAIVLNGNRINDSSEICDITTSGLFISSPFYMSLNTGDSIQIRNYTGSAITIVSNSGGYGFTYRVVKYRV